MKISIIGTRGIPNNYGGFEQFAEYLAQFLVEMGHEVYVYCSSLHKYTLPSFNGVNLVHMKDFENKIGTAGQFIYDLNCFIDARKRNYDIILQLGYTSSSIWMPLLPRKAIVITNMDGLEWKRSKFNFFVKQFLKIAERIAVAKSSCLVSDSIGIQNYLKREYNVDSTYIPYGADVTIINSDTEILKGYGVIKGQYNMLVARMEPENNIEVILDGFHASTSEMVFLVVGNYATNKFGAYLRSKFSNDARIIFVGGIYDMQKLNVLRSNCNIYFHGHSVGGTNPSLLEAMASNAFICANENEFNRGILGANALYFDNFHDIKTICEKDIDSDMRNLFCSTNVNLIQSKFNWHVINMAYLNLFNCVINTKLKLDYATYN